MSSCSNLKILIQYAFRIFLKMITLLEMGWGKLATTVREQIVYRFFLDKENKFMATDLVY